MEGEVVLVMGRKGEGVVETVVGVEGEEEESRRSFRRLDSRSSSKSKFSNPVMRTMSLIFPALWVVEKKKKKKKKKLRWEIG